MAYQNFFTTKLFNDIGAADTTITLETPPTATSGRLVFEARNATKREIVKYTGVAGNTITGVTRGQGGTSATPHTKNSLVEMNLTSQDIQDLYDAFGTFAATNNDWRSLVTVPTLSASNGQREYVLTYPGVDYTGTLSAGMKLKIPRTGTTPTQSMRFIRASNQYAQRTASVTGGTFTGVHSHEAWIYIDNYPSTNYLYIIGREGTTSGYGFRINALGQLEFYYASGAGYTVFNTYQSVPIKRMVHVAGVVTDVASKFAIAYIDGVAVPLVASTSGASSVLVNGTSIGIGTNVINGAVAAVNHFDGYIQEVRTWSTARTVTQIRDNMNKTLVGNEAGLVNLFQGNGNFNDKTANANHLTAVNGAVATGAMNAHQATEYAIITEVTKPGSDTLVKVFVPTGTGIPTETLGTTSYSTARTPLGFPADKGRWSIISWFRGANTFSGAVANTQYNTNGWYITIPTGTWTISHAGIYQLERAGAGVADIASYLSTTNASTTGQIADSIVSGYISNGASFLFMNYLAKTVTSYTATANTVLYTNYFTTVAGTVSIGHRGDWPGGNSSAGFTISAECNYL